MRSATSAANSGAAETADVVFDTFRCSINKAGTQHDSVSTQARTKVRRTARRDATFWITPVQKETKSVPLEQSGDAVAASEPRGWVSKRIVPLALTEQGYMLMGPTRRVSA